MRRPADQDDREFAHVWCAGCGTMRTISLPPDLEQEVEEQTSQLIEDEDRDDGTWCVTAEKFMLFNISDLHWHCWHTLAKFGEG